MAAKKSNRSVREAAAKRRNTLRRINPKYADDIQKEYQEFRNKLGAKRGKLAVSGIQGRRDEKLGKVSADAPLDNPNLGTEPLLKSRPAERKDYWYNQEKDRKKTLAATKKRRKKGDAPYSRRHSRYGFPTPADTSDQTKAFDRKK